MTAVPKVLRPGENRAMDAAVLHGGDLLLVLRGDGGGWALPGGMVEPGESDVDAALRELSEETGVDPFGSAFRLLPRRPVDDPRNDAVSWITTAIVVFEVADRPQATAGDDAADVTWCRLVAPTAMDAVLRADTGAGLYPAHAALIADVLTVAR